MEQAAPMEDAYKRTDKSLLEAYLGGDKAAFSEIVRRYGDSLLGYLTNMTGSIQLAEDLFQETFKKVHQKAHTFSGGRFKAWLFSIAINVAIDGYRRHNKGPKVFSLSEEDTGGGNCGGDGSRCLGFNQGGLAATTHGYDPPSEAIRAEHSQRVREAIESLPVRQRAMLILAYYQQLSYSEVAEVLRCSVGSVKSQMYRALRHLADRLPDISGGT